MANNLAGALAVVGVAGRFPGAPSAETFWRNLCAEAEPVAATAAASAARATGDAAPAAPGDRAHLSGPGGDGARLPWTARLRPFVDCATTALREAGGDAGSFAGSTGLFLAAGSGDGAAAGPGDAAAAPQAAGGGPDGLAAEAARQLDLNGPATTVAPEMTALAAVQLACQSLRNGDCDLALAGEIVPADGAAGGEGIAVVALKRLPDALAAGDRVLAIIRGSAAADAPALDPGAPAAGAEAASIALTALTALNEALAGIPVETVGYVEACAAATAAAETPALGALIRAFAAAPAAGGHCAIGTTGRGVGAMAGLITAVMTVDRGLIPPRRASAPLPADVESAPGAFSADPALRPWQTDGSARRAVVAATGRTGAAAYVVLEQPPGPFPRLDRGAAEAEPRPLRERPTLANAFVPPANHLEAAIASVWQELLGVDRVGVEDNFFELGGTSLAGVKIVALLKDWLHQDIPTVSLYEGPTVSALAKVILKGDRGGAKSYDLVRERGERRRRKLQRLAQGAGQGAAG